VKRQSETTAANSQTQPTQSKLAASEHKEEMGIHQLTLLPRFEFFPICSFYFKQSTISGQENNSGLD